MYLVFIADRFQTGQTPGFTYFFRILLFLAITEQQSKSKQQSTMRTMTEENPSIPSLLNLRTTGRCHSISFQNRITRKRSRTRCLITSPTVESLDKSLTDLHLDAKEHRFLLTGSSVGVVSVYDLSKWGSSDHLQGGHNHNISSSTNSTAPNRSDDRRQDTDSDFSSSIHKPIARSVRVPAMTDSEQVPAGHSSTIRSVRWYPSDAGAFLSASSDGNLIIWDTACMTPVARFAPLQHSSGSSAVTGAAGPSLHCMELAEHHCLAAVASPYVREVKLLDLRSGAASHSLVGHVGGIQAVQWSPACAHILATGGLDGCVRLWDIRKAGSRSCLAVLNRDAAVNTTLAESVSSAAYQPDYSHWRQRRGLSPQKPKSQRGGGELAPNNYQAAETSAAVSHQGPVTGLAFCDSGHSLLSTGADGELLLWDLAGAGQWVPRRFVLPGGRRPVDPTYNRTPMITTHDGDGDTVWIGNGSRLATFSVHQGGTARQVLSGHLNRIQAIQAIPDTMQLLTCASDGLILTWGPKSTVSMTANNKRKRLVQEDRDSW
jgi:DNA excision repair protein ERCC-8